MEGDSALLIYMNKFYFPIFIVVSLIIVGLVCCFSFIPSKEAPELSENEAVLVIDFGESKRAFIGQVIDEMTIIDALMASASAGQIDFDYQEGVLQRVADAKQDNQKKWDIYLNGKEIRNSPDKVLIQAGDEIELRFE